MDRRTRTASLLLASLLVATTASAASGAGRLRDLIGARDWKAGTKLCDGLPQSEGRRPDVRQLPRAHFAELAALCAVLADGAGDPAQRDWWWFTATAMDVATATRLLGELRAAGQLLELAPPRKPVQAATPNVGKTPHDQVTLTDGSVVEGEHAGIAWRPQTESWMFPRFPGVSRTMIIVEIVVAADGSTRQPVVVSSQAPPLHGFQAMRYFRGWRLTPARVGGRPVDSVFQVSVSTTYGP